MNYTLKKFSQFDRENNYQKVEENNSFYYQGGGHWSYAYTGFKYSSVVF